MNMINQPHEDEVPALEVRNLVMEYGAVRALRGVSFKAYRGEVLGLLGDNGAGKSTTVKIIAGSQAPSSGEMLVHGKPVHFQNPEDAREAGIETVFQDLALVENLDVVGNLFLNREEIRRKPPLSWLGWLDKKRMSSQSVDWLGELQIRIPSLGEEVMNLSGGQRQAVSVARAVAWGRDIVLLDEPAAALGVEQSAGVLRLIEQLASNGVCVILVSHNMQHVLDVCQRVVVLRHGEKVADQEVAGMTGQDLVGLITGASINIRGVV